MHVNQLGVAKRNLIKLKTTFELSPNPTLSGFYAIVTIVTD